MNKFLSKKIKLRRSLSYKGSLLMIFLLGLFAIYPPIRVLPYFNNLWATCFILWFLFVALDMPRYLLISSKFMFFSCFYLLYTFIISYMTGNEVISNRYLELSQLPFFYLAFEKNKIQSRNSDNLLIVKWLFPFILATSLITLSHYIKSPEISRMLKTSQGIGFEYSRLGVGGYEFIYFLLICIPILLFIFFGKNFKLKKYEKIFGLILILIFSINIVFSNFMIGFILLFISYLLHFFFKKIKSTKILIYLIILTILYFMLNHLTLLILDFLLANLDSTSRNAIRAQELKNYLVSSSQGIAIESRIFTFNSSIESFREYPILGIITEKRIIGSHGNVTSFGQHSQILDTFALFGSAIGIIQLYLYTSPFKSRMIFINDYINGLPLSLLIIFLTLVTINIATPSIGFAVFFIFPAVYEKYLENQVNRQYK